MKHHSTHSSRQKPKRKGVFCMHSLIFASFLTFLPNGRFLTYSSTTCFCHRFCWTHHLASFSSCCCFTNVLLSITSHSTELCLKICPLLLCLHCCIVSKITLCFLLLFVNFFICYFVHKLIFYSVFYCPANSNFKSMIKEQCCT